MKTNTLALFCPSELSCKQFRSRNAPGATPPRILSMCGSIYCRLNPHRQGLVVLVFSLFSMPRTSRKFACHSSFSSIWPVPYFEPRLLTMPRSPRSPVRPTLSRSSTTTSPRLSRSSTLDGDLHMDHSDDGDADYIASMKRRKNADAQASFRAKRKVITESLETSGTVIPSYC